jgi:hypothetical protein
MMMMMMMMMMIGSSNDDKTMTMMIMVMMLFITKMMMLTINKFVEKYVDNHVPVGAVTALSPLFSIAAQNCFVLVASNLYDSSNKNN